MPGFTDTAIPARRRLMGLVAIVAVSLAYPALAQNAATQALSVRTPERVREEMFVRIGGIDQWITIKGDDRNNPVVLFLHGGPGDALSPFADAMFGGWEKDFTCVQWDQRGAGNLRQERPIDRADHDSRAHGARWHRSCPVSSQTSQPEEDHY